MQISEKRGFADQNSQHVYSLPVSQPEPLPCIQNAEQNNMDEGVVKKFPPTQIFHSAFGNATHYLECNVAVALFDAAFNLYGAQRKGSTAFTSPHVHY